jgi:uncharacterized RDD family membrane protein YckC
MNNDILDDELERPESGLESVRYAGFGVRVGASLIDSLVLLPLVGLNYYNSLNFKDLSLAVVIAVVGAIYKPYMEYRYGATIGKMAVKVRVVNYELQAISPEQALIRYIPWILSVIISLLATISIFRTEGFAEAHDLMSYSELAQRSNYVQWMQFSSWIVPISAFGMLFNAYRQAVHDQLAKTFCIHVSQ